MTRLSELNTLRLVSNDVQGFTDSDDYKYIDILLTKYPDRTSKLLQFITGSYFTHASFGMSNSTEIFYSLVTKGF